MYVNFDCIFCTFYTRWEVIKKGRIILYISDDHCYILLTYFINLVRFVEGTPITTEFHFNQQHDCVKRGRRSMRRIAQYINIYEFPSG